MLTSHHDIIVLLQRRSGRPLLGSSPSLAPLPLPFVLFKYLMWTREKNCFSLTFSFFVKSGQKLIETETVGGFISQTFCSLVTLTPFFKKTSSFCVNKSQTWMLKTRSIRTLYYYYYLFYYYYYSWIDSNVTFWAQSRASAWESDDVKFIPEFILDRWNSSVIQFGSADTRKTSRVL